MAGFALPHDHGEGGHIENLHRELMNVAHFTAVSEIFKQLSDPTRVRIFWLLSHREECVINLAALLEMSSPAVSHHLRSLTESGLLVSRRDGKEVYYKAADTAQIRMLHEIVEQVMEIACPERTVDFQASQESIIRHVHDELTANLSERVTIEELSRKYLMNATNSQCLKWKLQVFLFPLKGKKDIMTNFFASLKENLSFVLVCLVVTAALILAAELAERLVMKKRHRLNTTRTMSDCRMIVR